ncbi:MAG: translation initiation factor IF-2 [Clostridia bacterium]|nr:translation initiation factor IF-2 [Clostridia bacterium]
MAKNELMDSVKKLEERTSELLERVKQLHGDVSASLQLAKKQESKLLDAEKAAAEAKAEREKKERRKEFLESGQNTGVYSSGSDETEPPVKESAPENALKEAAQAEPEPTPEKPDASRTPAADNKRGDKTPAYDARRQADRKTDRQGSKDQKGFDRQPRPQQDRRPGQYGDRQKDDPYGAGKDKDASDRPRDGERKPGGQQSGKSRSGGQTPTIIPQNNRQQQNKGQYVRTFDNDKKQPKNKKTIMKESAPSVNSWDDEGGFGNRKKSKKQQVQHKPEPVKIEKAILTSEVITVRELSEKIGKPAAEIIKKLFMMGNIATINNEIDFDTCELIAADYDIELELQLPKTAEEVLEETINAGDSEEDLVERPPVVTIMGHVDHGKTSLLDAIRNSSVTAGEAGGITQHIGAYTVTCNGRRITFIDTPGHEAFTAMRARGAQVTDVVILVVAADDGIMPQTIEAINHSKAAGVPIVVAINKMDKPEANPDRVLQQLTEHGLLCEDWGGDTICVPVSAKTHMNLNQLLEMVLLQAEVLELRANPKRKAKGTIIESQLDKGRGPVATVLVQNGTLRVGDPVVAGVAFGKVRAMMDDKGKRVKEAGPSTAVEVLGFNEVPSAGDEMIVADLDKLSKLVAEERRNKLRAEQMKKLSKVSLEDLYSHIAEGEVKDLNLVIKADVDGSVEAVKQALEKLSNEEVRVKCIHGAVGAITASDVMFASASNAIVIGFNVRPDSGAKTLAEQEKVEIKTYRVIYQAIEDVENAMKGMFKPVYKEVVIGTISVRSIFKVSGVGTIAGAYVSDGKVQRNAEVRVVRDGIVIHEGKIASLRRFKDDVKEVAQGYECGIGIENFNDIREDDTIEAFVMEEVKR